MDERDKPEEVNVQTAMIDPPAAPTLGPQLESLFHSYDDLVYRAAYRVTGSSQDAEDVLQTVFMRIWRRGTLPRVGEARAYFYRAAVNASLDLLRKRAHLRVVTLDDAPQAELSDGRANPEHMEISRSAQRTLRKAVAELGDTAAQMFVLRYFEGLENSEIAKLMDTSKAVVAVTLHRTRGKLQKQLNKVLGGNE